MPSAAPIVTSVPPSLLVSAAFSILGVTAAKVSVTVALRRMCLVSSTILRTFSTSPPDSLIPTIFGCSASSATSSTGRSYPVKPGTL